MKILALDQKVSGTGWCLAEDDEYLNSFYYKTKGKNGWAKILDLSIWMDSHLSLWHIDCLIVEFPSGNKGNMDTNIKLGAAMYACIHSFCWFWAKREHIEVDNAPFIIVRPTEVKATGIYKGQLVAASKYKEFVNIYKKDGSINKAAMDRQDDEIDGIGVWLAGLKRIRENDTNCK